MVSDINLECLFGQIKPTSESGRMHDARVVYEFKDGLHVFP